MRKRKQNAGFSLLELMIVVVIVGILAAVAFPMYQKQVISTRRSDATKSLLKLAQLQEKFFTECNRYATALVVPPPLGAGATACTLPGGPFTLAYNGDAGGNILSDEGHYTITLLAHPDPACTAATCYILDANPTGVGASGVQVYNGVSDGRFRIDHAGRRSWDRDNSGATDINGRYSHRWSDKKG